MRITVFTSNQKRHNYLINLLSKSCDELYVIKESNVLSSELTQNGYIFSPIAQKYFDLVDRAQSKIFGTDPLENIGKNINILPLKWGGLSKCNMSLLKEYLNSDIYIVFGSSFIRGDLINFLIDRNAINIHMGVSPFYRGTDCNFWAIYDNNPHLVGATIHLLSKGLDSGPILYHALSEVRNNLYEYTMSTVKSAFVSLAIKIEDESIFKISSIEQKAENQIRYSKKSNFTDSIIEEFFEREIILRPNEKVKKNLFKDPYILKKNL